MQVNIKIFRRGCMYVLLCLVLSQCVGLVEKNVERGESYGYVDGLPEVRMNAYGYLKKDSVYVDVDLDIVYSSLIYSIDSARKYNANVELYIDLTEIGNVEGDGEHPSYEYRSHYNKLTFKVDNPNVVYDYTVYPYSHTFKVKPGDYEVTCTVIDQSSEQKIVRRTRVSIPNPDVPVQYFSQIVLYAIDNESEDNRYKSVKTYDVPNIMDTLYFRIQVTQTSQEKTLSIRSRILKFEADDQPARSMTSPNYSPSAIGYKGIRYDRYEVIRAFTRAIRGIGTVTIEYKFPMLENGNYRFEVYEETNQKTLYKARDFSIKSANYPNLKSMQELTAPLVYLMGGRAYQRMRAIQNDSLLKYEMDRFWLENIKSPSKARDVIRLYYERVEEANKYFSSFKEGWQTDQGMIYILFGMPLYIERSLNREQWYYSHNRYDNNYTFIFRRYKTPSKYYPFSNYLLQRSSMYFNIFYQQTQRWLSGSILTRQI